MPTRIVKLVVREGKIRWSQFEQASESSDAVTQTQADDEREYRLDRLRADTIDELTGLQRLLTDALQGRAEGDVRARARGALPQLVKLLGRHLFDALLTPPQQDQLERLAKDVAFGALLRLELEFLTQDGQVDERLASWPWEYLYSQRLGKFLAAASDLVINRKLAPAEGDGQLAPTSGGSAEPTRLLLVIARPRDLGEVLGYAVEEAVDALRVQRKIGDPIKLIEPRPAGRVPDYQATATFRELLRLLEEKRPHIVHFIGHGLRDEGGVKLAFVASDGTADPIDGATFAEAIASAKSVRLAVLQACESALPDPHTPVSGVALQLAQKRVPAIVAMQARISNQAADQFSCAFYAALAEGHSVDRAVMRGRQEIKLQRDDQPFGIPVLYLRSYKPVLGPVTPEAGPAPEPLSAPTCPQCREPISLDDRFCSNCALAFLCPGPTCGRRLKKPLANFCEHCRTPLRDRLESAPAARAAEPGPAAPAGATNVYGLRGGGA